MDIERKDDLPRLCVVHWTSDFGQFSRQRRKQVSLTEVEVTVVNEVEEEQCVLHLRKDGSVVLV